MKNQANRLMSLLMALVILIGAAGCGGQVQETPEPVSTEAPTEQVEQSEQNENAADLVFKNGVIQTMKNEEDVAQAVAISGDTIVYVGDDAGAEEFIGENTQVIDLEGRFMSPGFMDGHLHVPGMWLDRLFNISLEGMSTNEEYLEAIKKFVADNPDMEVYSGRPFMLNAYKLEDGSNPGPQKSDLDEICPDKPVIIKDVSGHSVWVNSKALEIAGITAGTPDPEGGAIARDGSGEPTGYLTDNAMHLVTDVIPIDYTDEMYEEAIKAFMKEANSMGVTGVSNFTRGGASINDVYHKLDENNELTLRMRIATTFYPTSDYEETLKRIKDGSKYNSDMMNTNLVKIFYDGVTESGTAVMLEPYSEAAGKGDSWYGEPIWDVEEFDKYVSAFDSEGVQVHVHAIGDGAVHETLNAIEKAIEANGERDARYTITHVCAVTDEDIQRIADMKVVTPLQFLWMYADPLYELEAAYVGEERALAFYPTKNMLEAGCIISGASDTPVTPYDVLDEIEVGVTRNSPYDGEDETDMHRWPEQALTAYQMLEIYTKNVAYQNYMEELIGTIEVGKKADLVVLSDNILTIEPAEISETQVVYTISDGRIVYEG